MCVYSHTNGSKWFLMPPYLTLAILRYGSGVSGTIHRKELCLPLLLGVLAIEKGAFGSLRLRLANLFDIYIHLPTSLHEQDMAQGQFLSGV